MVYTVVIQKTFTAIRRVIVEIRQQIGCFISTKSEIPLGVLTELGADLDEVRQQVIRILEEYRPAERVKRKVRVLPAGQ